MRSSSCPSWELGACSNATQNSLCGAINRRRGRCACRARAIADGASSFRGRGAPATQRTDQPAKEMPERPDHGKNLSGKYRITPCAKSFFCGCTTFWRGTGFDSRCGPPAFTEHPINRLIGLLQLFEMVSRKSADVRSQEPTKVHADTERIAVELERNAATKIKLEIQITDRFVVNTSVKAVVTDEIRRAS